MRCSDSCTGVEFALATQLLVTSVQEWKESPMKTAIATFSGAAALAVAVGFGGLGVSPAGGASPVTHPSASVPSALGTGSAPGGHGEVHHAVLIGCIAGLDC